MKKSYNKAFTLVELLAVIVILAIILVIAVPKIMDVINSSKKSTLETSVKMIASAAEKTKMQNTVLVKEDEEIKCEDVAKLSSSDYDLENCKITFDGNTAKVTVKGKGKFEGLSVCNGTKTQATATNSEDGCPKEKYSIVGKEWSEIIAAVQSDEYEFTVGEEHEVELSNDLGTHTLRIANTTPCSEVEVESQTACGFVLEFSDIITTHSMNSTSTNVGGFPASSMYAYLNTEETGIYNSLPTELKNAIIGTKVISSHGSVDTSNFTTEDVKLYLLSGEEIYGGYSTSTDTSIGTSRQLDYYEIQGVTSSNYSGAIKKLNGTAYWWWLRSADSSSSGLFYFVSYVGYWGSSTSALNSSIGVSPAFRLAM